MRTIPLILLGCLAGCLIGCKGTTSSSSQEAASTRPKDLIIGTWEAVESTPGKGLKLTFTKEGGLIMEEEGGTPDKAEGKYKFIEDAVFEYELYPPPEWKAPANATLAKGKMTAKVSKDELTTTDDKDKKETKFKKKS